MIGLLVAILILLLICYLVARLLDQTVAVCVFIGGLVLILAGYFG